MTYHKAPKGTSNTAIMFDLVLKVGKTRSSPYFEVNHCFTLIRIWMQLANIKKKICWNSIFRFVNL